jgi:adenine-specific DNA-methyltransferase
MTERESKILIKETFEDNFNSERFCRFVANLLSESVKSPRRVASHFVKRAYENYIEHYDIVTQFVDENERKIDVLIVYLKTDSTFSARTRQRNFALDYIKTKNKDAVLVAYVHRNGKDWRFSFVKFETDIEKTDEGKVVDVEEYTSAKRSSFLVGKHENSYTAKKQLLPIIISEEPPRFQEIEEAFSVEKVTKEFFEKYKELFHDVNEALIEEIEKKPSLKEEFDKKEISTVDFSKKLLGQMVFLYFLQKKGWFGVSPKEEWGSGPKNFLRQLFKKRKSYGENFFNDVLEPLFYEALAQDRGKDAIYPRLNNCRMPFLNGGLFEPMRGYSWEITDILLSDELFSNDEKDGEDEGTGILDVFDRYNFTVNESDPLEKEVAVDPEMLGKVFENLLDIKDRKSKGSFYTPREIVHYMCQECLINYLETETKGEISRDDIEYVVLNGETIIQNDVTALKRSEERVAKYGRDFKDQSYKKLLPEAIRENARRIDDLLMDIKVCDPAVGSGAFPLGMINEIVGVRQVLQVYLRDGLSNYDLKYHAIANSIHGVDLDPGAVEIARLRLWLSLVVEEKNPRPLPNLEHRIMQGNSLLSEYEGVQLFNKELLARGDEDASVQFEMIYDSGIKGKIEELERNIKLYVETSQRSQKERLKESIDKLRWEVIEETLKEQGRLDKVDEIRQLREKNVRPFFVWELEFSEVFINKGGFDVVIGNPPYVGVKGHSEIFEPIRGGSLGKYFTGRGELFYFFFHLSFEIASEKSIVAFITTNYYLTASDGNLLRTEIRKKATVLSLINFNELKIFDSAKGQHNMITVLRKTVSNDIMASNCITKRNGMAKRDILMSILHGKDEKTEYFKIAQEELYDGKENYIRIRGVSKDTSKVNLILSKISENEVLDNICHVRQGLRTGIDRISESHISRYGYKGDKGQGVFIVTEEELRELRLSEEEELLVKALYKNSDIYKYCVAEKPSYFLFYIDKTHNELTMQKGFPGIYQYLSRFKELIIKIRKSNTEKEKEWITLDRPRERFIFESPKIVAPQRSYKNVFGYTEENFYASADVYYILEKDKDYNIKYILALINSKLYYFWLYYRGKRKGEMLELYRKPLSEIPIKQISLKIQQNFIDNIDRILDITASSNYNPDKPPQDQKILEKKIDKMVYELYGLTNEEIKLVEETYPS